MIAHSVAEIVKRHVRPTVEGIDRMYLNVYVPGLQYEHGINRFFRYHRGQPLPSAALMSPMTRNFVAGLEDLAARHGIPLVQFEKGQRKDAVMAEHCGTLPARKEWCSSARPRRTPPYSEPNGGAIRRPAGPTRRSCGAAQW
jgi:hypothetical protein